MSSVPSASVMAVVGRIGASLKLRILMLTVSLMDSGVVTTLPSASVEPESVTEKEKEA